MAIKVYGDKIVFPDNTEQTTSAENIWTDNGGTTRFLGNGNTVATQVWAENSGNPAKIIQKSDGSSYFMGHGATFFGTGSELPVNITVGGVNQLAVGKDSVYSFQPLTAPEFIGDGSKLTGLPESGVPEAPEDGETYARNNATWVSISDSSGIPDAPVDGAMYGRRNGEWDTVADAGDIYTKAEIDAQQNAQDVNIQANTDAIADLPAPVDTYTKTEIDTQQNAQDVEIAKKANTADTYTKTQTDTLLDNKANVGDSYTKAETYNNTEIDAKLFEKADKTTTYTKDEVDASQDAQDVNISGNTSAIGTLSGRVSANEADIATLQDGIFFSSSYTAEYPDNPNRDPQTGNMYMQDLSAFTYSYADTNQVFLSKTDEQGNVRQFTAVKPDDTIVLNQVESPNYGRYKVVSVNDVGAYVSLVVVFQIGEGTLLEGDTVALQAFPASDSIWTEEDGKAVYGGDIKVNGVTVGRGNGDSDTNTVVGNNAFANNLSGRFTTAFGNNALENCTANGNSAFGIDALKSVSTGANNTGLGNYAGSTLTTGRHNILIGESAQPSAPDTSFEVTIGNDNITQTRLKGVVQARDGVIDVRDHKGGSNVSTIKNEAQGAEINFDCQGSTRMSVKSGGVSTIQDMIVNGVTVGRGGGTAPLNTVVGRDALREITTGNTNTAIGREVLLVTTDGNGNTSVGTSSLMNATSGDFNTALGFSAGKELTSGFNNLFLGNDAQPSSPTVDNEVTIGNAAVTTVRMGNGDVIYPASGGSGGAGSIKSWVKFNGTGTVTMNGQSGISSVTDEGVGMYRVNFASAMPNANYAMNYGGSRVATNISSSTAVQTFCYDPTASNMKVATFTLSGSLKDHEIICVSIIN